MIKLFLKTTWRNIRKNSFFSVLHICGLGLAFMVAILLFLSADFELSFNRQYTQADRTALLYTTTYPKQDVSRSAVLPQPLAPTLKAEIPSIEAISRYGNGGMVLKQGNKEISVTSRFVDPDFFSLFDIKILQGKLADFAAIDAVVLSARSAISMFGSIDCIGQEFQTFTANGWENRMVTAVVADQPKNSSIQFQSLQRFEKMPLYAEYNASWTNNNHNVFARFKTKEDIAQFKQQTKTFVQKHFTEDLKHLKQAAAGTDKDGNIMLLEALPLHKMHLNNLGLGDATNPIYPWMLLLLTALVLFIACSNFVNLSMASYLNRSLEIAIKKSLGNSPNSIALQLCAETFIVALVALLLALIGAYFILPVYNAKVGYSLALTSLMTLKNTSLLLSVFMLLSLLSGGYPAWMIAKINTVTALKGKFKTKQGNRTKRILTVFQFSITTLLIITTMLMYRQLNYVNSIPLGFNKESVVSIPIGGKVDPEMALKRMREALANQEDIAYVTGTDINIGLGNDGRSRNSVVGFEFQGQTLSTNWLRVDYDYLKTMDIQLLAGRDFDRSRPTDTAGILINELMAEQLGGIDKVLNSKLPLFTADGFEIIGLVKNFHYKDLKVQLAPLSMFISPVPGFEVSYIFIRIKSTQVQNTLAKIEEAWKKINPNESTELSFLDENVNNQYTSERNLTTLISSASFLAIFVSCMGLFALILISTRTRLKEVGVRKVLGASIPQLMYSLSKEYLLLLGLAFIIALPIAWWAGNAWLANFAFRTEVDIFSLLSGCLLIIVIAGLTISFQTWRTAMANPVNSLRDE